MKKNKLKKIIFFTILVCVILISNFAFATPEDTIISGMSGISNAPTASGGVNGVVKKIVALIQYVGSGVSILVVTILGIKYMLAGPNEKGDIKKQAMPIIIGCVLLFGAVNVAGIIADFGTNINS